MDNHLNVDLSQGYKMIDKLSNLCRRHFSYDDEMDGVNSGGQEMFLTLTVTND